MPRKTVRRYVYEETEKEILDWVKEPITQQNMMKPPNNIANFPFYLEQYIPNRCNMSSLS